LSLEEALFSYLSDDPALHALVTGDDGVVRIYPVRLPEKCKIPAISWNRVDAKRIYTYDSFAETEAWVMARVQFNCWAYTAHDAMDVGSALLAALSGYDSDMAGELITAFSVNELDTYEPATKFHRRVLDFFISYEDALKTS
jgi:hypothetical protein